ncbi:MAG TPA: hypothetical protein VF171_01375 [Trueperaceae bacterium]
MAKLEFPLTLHARINLTGDTIPTECASETELVHELERVADATSTDARDFARQILGGAEVNVSSRGRDITLYATRD